MEVSLRIKEDLATVNVHKDIQGAVVRIVIVIFIFF